MAFLASTSPGGSNSPLPPKKEPTQNQTRGDTCCGKAPIAQDPPPRCGKQSPAEFLNIISPGPPSAWHSGILFPVGCAVGCFSLLRAVDASQVRAICPWRMHFCQPSHLAPQCPYETYKMVSGMHQNFRFAIIADLILIIVFSKGNLPGRRSVFLVYSPSSLLVLHSSFQVRCMQ